MKQVLKRSRRKNSTFLSVKRISKFGARANQASELADQGACKSCKKIILEGVKQVGECLSATRWPVQVKLLIKRLRGEWELWWWKQRHDPYVEEMKEWSSLLDKDREVAEAGKVKGDINKHSIGMSKYEWRWNQRRRKQWGSRSHRDTCLM